MRSVEQEAIRLIKTSGSLQDAIKQCKQIIYMRIPNTYQRKVIQYELILQYLEKSTTYGGG